MGKVIFVTGIDTGVGKSHATGYFARECIKEGYSVITQKFIQTGCGTEDGISEDIKIHRRLMGIDLLPEDLNGTTCPISFSYPASPHLAAEIDQSKIELGKMRRSTDLLKQKYDIIIIEGAGGIMTPTIRHHTSLNYIRERRYPVLIVTTPRLGSINHTLMTFEMCRAAKIPIYGVVYNNIDNSDALIYESTKKYCKRYLELHSRNSMWIEMNNDVLRLWVLEIENR
jgi:dethiobiotin synthetase